MVLIFIIKTKMKLLLDASKEAIIGQFGGA
jgi:hypothetical protein